MQKNLIALVTAAIITIAVVGVSKHFLTAAKCKDRTVIVNLELTKLPYRTQYGQSLSIDGLPRGRFEIAKNSEITQMELSAIMLKPEQYLIKQVVMIGGNFPRESEFEFSDRSRREISRRTKVVDRIELLSTGSNTNFIYLFAKPQLTRWNGTRIVAVEMDNAIPIARLSVRRVSSQLGKWVEGEFVSTNEQIESKYARRNKKVEAGEAIFVYGASEDSCLQD